MSAISPIKIAIVGPESTGKSSIAALLARHYNATYVEEQARSYIDNLKRPYTLKDILAIAKSQVNAEEKFIAKRKALLFCDTTVLVTKIWAENAFQICPPYIQQKWKEQDYALHLLMDIDLPWEPDPQREHPHLRRFFFNWYESELKLAKANYKIVSGVGNDRLASAIRLVDAFLQSQS